LPNLILDNNMLAARRVIKAAGINSIEVGIARRSVFDEMIRRSRSILKGDDFIDPDILASQYNALTPSTLKFLFGKDRKTVGNLIRLLNARHGTIDISGIKGTVADRPIIDILKQVVKQERETQKIFETKILKPFLNGEIGHEALDAEGFVRHVIKKASNKKIKQLYRLLPKRKVEDFQAATVEVILDKAANASLNPEAQALALIRGKGRAGVKLAQILEKSFGVSIEDSLNKLKTLLPMDTVRLLEDYALVQAGRNIASAEAKAVGGLVGGAVMASFITLQWGVGFKLAKGRFLAEIMRLKPVRTWLTSRREIPGTSGKTNASIRAFQVALPQIIETATEQLGEASPQAQIVFDFFTQDVPNSLGYIPEPKPGAIPGETLEESVGRLR